MRLIKMQTLEMETFDRFNTNPESAILSHTWSKSEVSFQDYQAAYKASHKKIRPDARGEEFLIDTGKGMLQWECLLRPEKYKFPKDTSWGKIAWACREARNNQRGGRADHLWIDTCCIGKTIRSEENEAISVMIQSYGGAKVCYACLQDVSKNEEEYNKLEESSNKDD